MKLFIEKGGISNEALKEMVSYLKMEVSPSFDFLVKRPSQTFEEVIDKYKVTKDKIISDLELYFLFDQSFKILITGTNLKTTTTLLLNHLLKEHQSIACGNVGYPLGKAFFDYKKISIIEASSFMLEGLRLGRADVFVIQKIDYAHMDHHQSFKEYFYEKTKMIKNLKQSDIVIYDYEDLNLRKLLRNRKNTYSFSTLNPLSNFYIKNKKIYFENEFIMKDNLNISKNALLAAIAVLKVLKIKIEKKKFKSFKAPNFRLELIKNKIYNDSKSTNLYSTSYALKKMKNKVHLIMGGFKRNENLNVLDDSLDKIRDVYVYGEASNDLLNYFKEKKIHCFTYHDLESLVLNLHHKKNILFSPGFASFDHYKSYIERGNHFNQLLKKYRKV